MYIYVICYIYVSYLLALKWSQELYLDTYLSYVYTIKYVLNLQINTWWFTLFVVINISQIFK